ncbi:MAG: carboxypeptidase regulatory-like domain-containing protein [Bryobacteraceae bacterium]
MKLRPNPIHGRLSAALVVCVFSCLTPCALGQVNPVGSVDGDVRDVTGGLLTGTQVTLTNTGTNLKKSNTTNEQGVYYFNLVLPGKYRLEVERAGFRRFSRTVTVESGRKLTVNITMTVGDVQDRVEVVADAPMLETSTASTSTTVNRRFIAELPMSGRNVMQLSILTAGVVQMTNPLDNYGLDNRSAVAYFSSNGASYRMNNFLMDGVPNQHYDTISYMPPADQVQEFNIQTNSFDAEYGHGGGAYVNVTTRSGTNQLHGSLYEYLRNDALNATNFFNKWSRLSRPSLRYNQFGGAAGGRVIKDKLFWFFNYEGVRNQTPNTVITTVPTDLQRQGDFSRTLDASARQIAVFDPFSTRPNPSQTGRFLRTQFPGNVIPASTINPAARNIIAAYVPTPNLPGNINSGTNNYVKTLTNQIPMNNFTVRVDYSLGSRHRIFGRESRTNTPNLSPNVIDVGTALTVLTQHSVGIGDTIMLTPATTLVLSAGLTRYDLVSTKQEVDLIKLGFAANWVQSLQQRKLAQTTNPDMVTVGASGGSRFDKGNQYSFLANMSHFRGRQNMKWGFQTQIRQNNSLGSNAPSGAFAFTRAFTQGPDPNTTGSAVGDGIASYLIGTPASGNTTIFPTNSAQTPYYGFYFQDDIRVSSRMTVNMGLRYDLKRPATERFNNMSRWDFAATNPIDAAARAAYSKNPIPELPLDQFKVVGGLTFATPGGRRAARTDTNDWGPRIGLTFRLTEKTVLRTGFGLFYDYWSVGDFGQDGFSSSTPMVASLDGVTPLNLLNNPFPDGLVRPPGSAQGLTTLLGTSMQVFPDRDRNPYNERWQFGIQRELMKDLSLEVNYVGETAQSLYLGNRSSGSNGEMTRQLKVLPAQYLSLGSRLQATVPNPFAGLIPSSVALGRPTISVQNLLSTWSQMGDLTVRRSTGGRTYYHALQTTATKRFSHGFQFLGTYTFSRQIEKVQFLNDSDPEPSKAIGFLWAPHRITLSGVYELPFGAGKPFLKQAGVVDKLVGGWQLSAIQTFQSGSALLLPDVLYTGVDPRLPPNERSVTKWFNTAAFTVLPSFTLRNVSTRLARLRGDAIVNYDLSLSKSVKLTERLRLQLRGEAFNAFNRLQYGAPNLTPSSGSYGRITNQANAPRSIQLGARLEF